MVLDVIETHAKHAHRAAHHHLKKLVPGASGGMVFVCVALAVITCVAGVFWAYPNLMAPTKVRKVNVAEPPEHPLVAVAMGFSPGAIVGIFLVALFVGGGLVYIVRFGSGLIPSNSAPSSACRGGGVAAGLSTTKITGNSSNITGNSSNINGPTTLRALYPNATTGARSVETKPKKRSLSPSSDIGFNYGPLNSPISGKR